MSNSLIIDDSTRAAQLALDGLSQRQQLISRNLANIDTPGYRAKSFEFESALRNVFNRKKGALALDSTSAGHITSSATPKVGFSVNDRPGGSVRADQNNVDIDAELVEMSETGIVYQAVSQSVSRKLQLLKSIANSR